MAGFVRDTLHVPESKAGALLRALRRQVFLSERRRPLAAHSNRNPTSGATAAKPLLRQTAERLLHEFPQRITALNEDSRFLARASREENRMRQLLERVAGT
jgi:hypothetical protein